MGVLKSWNPQPRYYDMTVSSFARPDAAYVPFACDEQMHLLPNGHMSCYGPNSPSTYRQLLGSDCVWVLLWVELPGAARRERFRAFMDTNWAAQRGDPTSREVLGEDLFSYHPRP